MKDLGRVQYETATDKEVVAAFFELSRTKCIIPVLESAHGLAYAMKIANAMNSSKKLLVNLSGRGEKDLDSVWDKFGNSYGMGKRDCWRGRYPKAQRKEASSCSDFRLIVTSPLARQ